MPASRGGGRTTHAGRAATVALEEENPLGTRGEGRLSPSLGFWKWRGEGLKVFLAPALGEGFAGAPPTFSISCLAKQWEMSRGLAGASLEL